MSDLREDISVLYKGRQGLVEQSRAKGRPALALLDAAFTAAGLEVRGSRCGIYLGDPRRSAPGKLRTLISHPVV